MLLRACVCVCDGGSSVCACGSDVYRMSYAVCSVYVCMLRVCVVYVLCMLCVWW